MRSILLVSGTTIVGLAPLLVHMNDTADKDIWENLSLANVGGVTSSTFLILLITPVVYTSSIRLGWQMRHFAAWVKRKVSRRARELAPTSNLG
jgi:Cu/Ag efflux pump CusA